VKIVGQSADMSPHPDLPIRTNPARGAVSRDAGLLRIRTVTKGAAVAAAFGSVALGVVFAHPAQSQAASVSGQGSVPSNARAVTPPSNQQQQLAPPPAPPAGVAPQAMPQAVSGGS
jgi:hypothetical protein